MDDMDKFFERQEKMIKEIVAIFEKYDANALEEYRALFVLLSAVKAMMYDMLKDSMELLEALFDSLSSETESE